VTQNPNQDLNPVIMSYKVKTACLPFSLSLVSLLFCLIASAQKKGEVIDHRFDAVDQLFNQNQKALGNDYVALVWKDGKIIYQKQGSQDFSSKMPAPAVGAADWMTAALVMTFVDEGKLSLDDKITKYIPMFGKYMKGYITIRNCLTNTTGIKVDEGIKKALEKIKYESLEDEVNSYAAKRDIGTNPSTEFFYSNLGPNIAARVLEVISKKGFDRLMMDRIIRPLKMHGTSFSSEDGGAINPAGGARITANDYIAFLVMLMNKGMSPDNKRVLSEKSVQEMETAQFTSLPVKFVPRELQGAQFGLGCFITAASAGGSPSVLACPNMLGTTPYIDKCRNYAAILIIAKPEEEKKTIYLNMMNLVNAVVGGGCN
jgi:CubicO group peptidase (beta-lactamase class C family)